MPRVSFISMGQKFVQSVWLYVFVFIPLCLFYYGIFSVQGAWLVADHAEQHFPWAYELAGHLKEGSLPFWTDGIHAGFPLVAEGQVGAFYLPNVLFYAFLPIREGYAWNIIFHLMLSAFFMLAYLKSLGVENKGAFFGTFVYLFGSTLGGAYYNITSLKVLTWFPLTLILVDKILLQKKMAWGKTIGLGVLFSLQLLAGYLQFAAYAILFTGLYLLFRFFDQRERDIRAFAFSIFGIILAVLIATLIAFPQLALTYELALRSNRAGAEEGFAYVGSYSPFALACLFFPSLEGLFVSKLYLGILPLFFMLVTFFFFKKHPMKSLYFLVVVGFLLALGQWSPLYVAIVKLFRFYSFRTPVKFVFFAGFFLSVLCAYGVQYVLERKEERKLSSAGTSYVGMLTVVLLGYLAAFAAFNLWEKPLYQLGEWLVAQLIYGKPGHPFAWEHYQMRLTNFIQHAQYLLDPRSVVILVPVIKMIAACILILSFISKRLSAIPFYLFSVALLVADLNMSYSDIQGDYANYDRFFQKSGVARFLEDHSEDSRYFNYSQDPSAAPLPASKNMIHGLETVNAYSPLVLKNYYDFFSYLGGVNDSIAYHPVNDEYFGRQLRNLGMLNVKYIVSDQSLRSQHLKKVFREGDWAVYENSFVMEKLNLIPAYEIEPDYQSLLTRIQEGDFNPRELALMETEPEFFGDESKPATGGDSITVLGHRPSYWSLEVESSRNQILVFSQTYYPGWKATVDGKEARLYRVNAILTGLPLKRGHHSIILDYSPFRKFLKR